MATIAADEYNLNDCGSALTEAEVDARVQQLKDLCGLVSKPIDKQRCLSAILKLRSQQHTAAMHAAHAPYPAEPTASINEVPASPSRGQAADLSAR
jgi:hypothetical protein